MCITAMTMLMVGSKLAEGAAAQAQADSYAQQAEHQAAIERDAAQAEAEKVRKLGARQRSSMRAAYGASGVRVNEGTALDMQQEVTNSAEHDAMMSILTGERRAQSWQFKAAQAKAEGKSAMAKSLLGAGASATGGWKTNEPTMTRDDRQGF